jgi:hypothetical protein
METNWKLLLINSDIQYINLLNNKLEASGITSQVMDKSDSMFPSVGESELYVSQNDYDRAVEIVNEHPARPAE